MNAFMARCHLLAAARHSELTPDQVKSIAGQLAHEGRLAPIDDDQRARVPGVVANLRAGAIGPEGPPDERPELREALWLDWFRRCVPAEEVGADAA